MGAFGTEVAAFGSTVERSSTRLAAAPVAKNELRYGDPRDAVLAELAVRRAAIVADVVADPTVDGFLFRVAGTPTRHACAAAACPAAEGEALAACLATSCP
jgi:hypothetical protein